MAVPTGAPFLAAPVSIATPRFLQIPTDSERSPASGFEPGWSGWTDLAALSRRPLDAALQGELLGALVALLHRYTQQAEIALDAFVRDASGESRLVIDAAVSGESSAAALAAAARARLAEEKADRASHPDIRPSRSNVAATFLPADPEDGDAPWEEPARSACDIHFVFRQAGESTQMGLVYNASLLRPASAARLAESYQVLLRAALADPDAAVEQLPLLSREGILAIIADQGSAASPAEPPCPVHRLFEAHARRHPQAVAASCAGRAVTYGELDDRCNRLAHHLRACGVGREVPVAVCVRPSLDVLVALLAIWKAGGVYLPLDPTHPPALVTRMLDDARPRLVLTTSALADLAGSLPRFCFDTDADLLGALPATAPALDAADPALDTAYIFYTSGTTGRSKGVAATQGNLAQYVHSAAQKYGFGPGDVFASLARYTFSISLFELVSPLACGGSLRILERDAVLSPERLFAALGEVTVLHAGPSLLGSLFRYLRSLPEAPALPRMRHASSGGDMVSPSVMEEMKRVFPDAELFVIYGCTEIGCMGTTFPIPRDRKVTRSFVGKPFPEVAVRVVDANDRVVPFGVVGEIAFAGKGIARGYLDRPELTAQKFAPIDGLRFYRTGDMGRLHPDGNLEILGRRDFQVQVRGMRVELAGIEKMVLELGLAAQCAVVAKAVDEGDLRLVAYAVKPISGGLPALRRALSAELPDYMLPHHLVALEAMPLTVNGKLDRHQLMEMPIEGGAAVPSTPGGDLQRTIADAFARVLKLGLGQIGSEDTFFDLGGDSLLGVYVLQEIERSTGIAIPPHVLFESGTVEALARRAESPHGGDDAEPNPIPLNSSSSKLPLFMLSGVNIYRELALRLERECAAYGLFLRREVDATADPQAESHSVEDLARDYVRVIRRQQPAGPYRLLGYSFAGIVAYEVAQQLRTAGEEVRFLGLVDAFLPEWTLGWRFRLAQLERLGTVPPRDLLAFVRRRWRETRDPTYADLGLYHGDENVGPLEERRFALNGEAAARYMTRIRSLPLAVTVIMSGGRLRADPLKSRSGGWRRYVRQLDLHTVDAPHFPLIRTDPHVSETARLVAKGIQRAEWNRRRRRAG